jgi:oligopeptide/dipeptide ABC transporter ATP-binding protein
LLLQVSDLSISFNSIFGKSHIIDGISMEIEKGEIVGIVGESGSGKSVTSLAILGLLANNALINKGEIHFKDRDLLKLTEKDFQKIRGKEIGMVFQEPMTALNPTMRIGKQLANVIKNHKNVSKKKALELTVKSLEDVLIENAEAVSQKYPFQLSGGMRQRVVIALAMSAPPELLIADEPTTALDVTVQQEILNLMKDLSEKKGTSIMFVTHDLGVVANFCDRVYVMYGGKIVEAGTTKEVLYHSIHPYTKGLIASLPEGKSKNEPLEVIMGDAFNPKERPEGCVFFDRCSIKTDRCLKQPPVIYESKTHWAACWEVEIDDAESKKSL